MSQIPSALLLPIFAFLTGPTLLAQEAISHGDAVARVWEVTGSEGSESWFSMSLDGGLTFGRPRSTEFVLRLRYSEFDPLRDEEPGVSKDLRAGEKSELFMVQFKAKSVEPWRQAVESKGAVQHRFLADHSGIWRMSAAVAAEVATLPFVRWVGFFHPAYKLEDELLAGWAHGMLPALRRYRIVVGGAAHVNSGEGYAIYVNGKLLAESKTGVAVRQGGQPRGAHIYSDFRDEFKGGKVTLAATSFLRYNHPRNGIQPPRGHFSLWIEEQKLPPVAAASGK